MTEHDLEAISDEEREDNWDFIKCHETNCKDYGKFPSCYFNTTFKYCFEYINQRL